MDNIVLIGMPGAGKSTVGVLLAKAMRRPFVDTDLIIQAQERRFLQEIIDHDGMERFLDLEAKVIRNLRVSGHVIATGGSVIYRDEAMASLRAVGILVYLALPYDDIEHRLRDVTTRGIAKAQDQTLADVYRERTPRYAEHAHIVVPAHSLTIEETVTRILAALRAHGTMVMP